MLEVPDNFFAMTSFDISSYPASDRYSLVAGHPAHASERCDIRRVGSDPDGYIAVSLEHPVRQKHELKRPACPAHVLARVNRGIHFHRVVDREAVIGLV